MRTLWASVVGSHAWNMQRPDSDIDIVEVVIDSARDFLTGRGMIKNVEIHENSGKELSYIVQATIDDIGRKGGRVDKYDVTQMEIGHLVGLLKKGNINAIWTVMSPFKTSEFRYADNVHDSDIGESDIIEKIVIGNLSIETWHSAKGCLLGGNGGKKHKGGLALTTTDIHDIDMDNVSIDAEPREHGLLLTDDPIKQGKKPRSAKRIIDQFVHMMDTGEVTFPAVTGIPTMKELDEEIAMIESRIEAGDHVLHEKINDDDFDKYLFETRCHEYRDEIGRH